MIQLRRRRSVLSYNGMLPNFQHKDITPSRWRALGIEEQLANIGSEVERAIKWKTKGNMSIALAAHVRALELFDLTLEDPRWRGARLREIALAREVFCDAVLGGKEYNSSLESLDKYFLNFAFAARNQ